MKYRSVCGRSITWLVLSVLLFVGSFGKVFASTPLPSGLSVAIAVDSSIVGSPSNMMIGITVSNDSSSTISFSRRGTVLDIGLEEDYLEVAKNGSAMIFSPIHIKRPAETDVDKVTLGPGESVTNSIPISQYYEIFDKGVYSVSLKSAVPKSFTSKSSAQQITVLRDAETEKYVQGKRTFAHRSCSSSRVSKLNDAIDQANLMARAAISDLNNTPVDSRGSAARYREWFGRYSASRYDQVSSNFTAIDNALSNQQISTDCGCTAIAPSERNNLFAYVFPNQPYIVNLCGAFWPAPLTGTDSKAGVIVHEVSHFTVVGGTIDNAVGPTASRNLAASNANASILNADNHEYFAENTPSLRMSSKDSECSVVETNDVSPIQQPQSTTFSNNSLSQAVDDINHNYLSQSPSFFPTTRFSTRGGDSAQSANIGDGQASGMITSVIGPGTVSFDWRVSSEANFDVLAFGVLDINGEVVGTPAGISGSLGFARRSFSFPAGQHFLVWAFQKDGSVSSGLDAGFVDNVAINDQDGGVFRSSNSLVTNILCQQGSITIAPIMSLLLDDEESTPK